MGESQVTCSLVKLRRQSSDCREVQLYGTKYQGGEISLTEHFRDHSVPFESLPKYTLDPWVGLNCSCPSWWEDLYRLWSLTLKTMFHTIQPLSPNSLLHLLHTLRNKDLAWRRTSVLDSVEDMYLFPASCLFKRFSEAILTACYFLLL